jgi:hypothetical protein
MTNEEKRKIYAALAAPFPEHCIQRTEGRITGRGYDTSGPRAEGVSRGRPSVDDVTPGVGRVACSGSPEPRGEAHGWVGGRLRQLAPACFASGESSGIMFGAPQLGHTLCRVESRQEEQAVAVCSPYLKCRQTRDVNECGSERYTCFVACKDIAEGLVYPPACELAHKATFGK